jgi:hypothetical protein
MSEATWMWIWADYYPGTNDSTYTDHGYYWFPQIGGGYYQLVGWVHTPNYGIPYWREDFQEWVIPITWTLSKGSLDQVWSTTGGPTLPDPYEPTVIPENPLPIVYPIFDKIFVNGHSMPLIDPLHLLVIALNAPLKIGPGS